MANFSKLKSKKVSNYAVIYEIYGINPDDTPSMLFVRPAGQSNSGYMNAYLKRMGSVRGAARTMITTERLEAIRAADRELYPAHVIEGWHDVKDDTNADVPFNEENCRALVAALPPHMFDELRTFCSEQVNFIHADVEEDAKN